MITLKNVTLRRGTKVVLDSVSTTINPGENVGLVGRNGAGKSSLFALLSGKLHEDGGDFHIPSSWRMAEVAQNMPETDQSATDFVLEGDTRLAEVQRQLAEAEASDDGMAIAHAYSDLHDAGEDARAPVPTCACDEAAQQRARADAQHSRAEQAERERDAAARLSAAEARLAAAEQALSAEKELRQRYEGQVQALTEQRTRTEAELAALRASSEAEIASLRAKNAEDRAAEKAEREKERLEKLDKQKQLADDKKRQAQEAQRKQEALEKASAQAAEARRQENIRRMQGLAGATGGENATGTALRNSGPSGSYGGKVAAKVRPNIVYPDAIAGNPRAVVQVRAAPDGTIVGKKLIQSSGNKAWDDAVLRALQKTETLPRDVDGRVPSSLVIGFRPKD